MTREIKFRAWDSKDQKMREVKEITFNEDNSLYCWKWRGFTSDGGMYGYESHGHVLMQYTGLKDKNGKEIYEGDVIDGMEVIFSTVGVQWEGDGKFYMSGWYLKDHKPSMGRSMWPLERGENKEVIGNIYENPELLK
jgi:uncharacterized phage protein (TIGR01671 family)